MSRIQTRHRELDEEIATFTKEYITFSQSSPDAADSEAVISRNAAEINELKTLIESEKSNNAEYWTTIQHYKSREDQENNAVETLKLELQGKSEALNRIKGEKEEVEKKLRDFVEAQKKIMAMCGGGTV